MVCTDALQDLISFCLQDFILEHYSEDSYLYEDEIADLMDLRQVRCCVQWGGEGRGVEGRGGRGVEGRGGRQSLLGLQNVLLQNHRWLEVIGRHFQNHP